MWYGMLYVFVVVVFVYFLGYVAKVELFENGVFIKCLFFFVSMVNVICYGSMGMFYDG